MDQQFKKRISSPLFLTILFISTVFNTTALIITCSMVGSNSMVSIINTLLLSVSCLQYLLAVVLLVGLCILYYRIKELEEVGTKATGMITMNVFLLFMIQVLHVLNMTIDKDKMDDFHLNLSITSIAFVLLTELTIFASLFIYVCPLIGCIHSTDSTNEPQAAVSPTESDSLLSITGFNQTIQS